MREWRATERGEMVLVGGGGHALVVGETARLLGWTVVGVLDDAAEPAACAGLGVARLGGLREFARVGERWWVMAVGDLAAREALGAEKVLESARCATLVHPQASVSPLAKVGQGVWVGPHAVIHTLAAVHDHAIVNSGAIVEHECEIGEHAHIAPGAVLGGRVVVGAGTLVGLGSRVLPGVRIGKRCTIGAGAVVRGAVRDGAKVVGVPGREV